MFSLQYCHHIDASTESYPSTCMGNASIPEHRFSHFCHEAYRSDSNGTHNVPQVSCIDMYVKPSNIMTPSCKQGCPAVLGANEWTANLWRAALDPSLLPV